MGFVQELLHMIREDPDAPLQDQAKAVMAHTTPKVVNPTGKNITPSNNPEQTSSRTS